MSKKVKLNWLSLDPSTKLRTCFALHHTVQGFARDSLRSLITGCWLLALTLNVHAAPCINWGKLLTAREIRPEARYTIAIQLFENYTAQAGDDWLGIGIPALLADYLKTSEDLNAAYGPILTHHNIRPHYVVQGKFQQIEGELRIFFKLLKGKSLVNQYEARVPYPGHKEFFDKTSMVAKAIMGQIDVVFDPGKLRGVREATSSTPAFENYIKGREAYWSFDPNKMEVAKIYFEEAKKHDFYYKAPYLGLVDLYTFLAIYSKQERKAFAGYFESAEGELKQLTDFSKRPPAVKKRKPQVIKVREKDVDLTNRFILANVHFISGLHAADSGNLSLAVSEFEATVKLTPEDAITYYHLSKIYDKLGQQRKAAKARARAYEVNKCLQ